MEIVGIIVGVAIIGFFALIIGSVIRKETTKYEYSKSKSKSYNAVQIMITLVIGLVAFYFIANFTDGCSSGNDDFRIIRRD